MLDNHLSLWKTIVDDGTKVIRSFLSAIRADRSTTFVFHVVKSLIIPSLHTHCHCLCNEIRSTLHPTSTSPIVWPLSKVSPSVQSTSTATLMSQTNCLMSMLGKHVGYFHWHLIRSLGRSGSPDADAGQTTRHCLRSRLSVRDFFSRRQESLLRWKCCMNGIQQNIQL